MISVFPEGQQAVSRMQPKSALLGKGVLREVVLSRSCFLPKTVGRWLGAAPLCRAILSWIFSGVSAYWKRVRCLLGLTR